MGGERGADRDRARVRGGRRELGARQPSPSALRPNAGRPGATGRPAFHRLPEETTWHAHGTRRRRPPEARLAGGARPRRQHRHAGGRPDRHAGAADGQARPGPGVPERRDRSRRALLHVPARHRHGDEHAGRVRAHELGDRLRRLDRRPGVGHAAGGALAGEDGHRPVRHGRPSRRRDPGLATHHAEAASSTSATAMGFRRQGGLRARVLPADRYLRAGLAQGLRRPGAVRLLQRGLRPAAGDQGRADPRQACATS